jgi:hypothetical protein
MWARYKAFWRPKHGNSEAEYEDAFWLPTGSPLPACETIRLAVADGATETLYANLWAKLLVRSYGKCGHPVDFLDPALQRIRGVWKKCVHQRPLPWYAEAKVQMGAFSSLLGLSVTKANAGDASPGTWIAHAVGDSCLFHIREDKCLAAFPLKTSGEFSSRPALLSSSPASRPCPSFTTDGCWKAGDVFFLMTDALACWFLAALERGIDPLESLRRLEQQEDFDQFIAQQRFDVVEAGTSSLRNDDVTMIVCEMTSDKPPPGLP